MSDRMLSRYKLTMSESGLQEKSGNLFPDLTWSRGESNPRKNAVPETPEGVNAPIYARDSQLRELVALWDALDAPDRALLLSLAQRAALRNPGSSRFPDERSSGRQAIQSELDRDAGPCAPNLPCPPARDCCASAGEAADAAASEAAGGEA